MIRIFWKLIVTEGSSSDSIQFEMFDDNDESERE